MCISISTKIVSICVTCSTYLHVKVYIVYIHYIYTAHLPILPHSHILLSSQGKQAAPILTLHHFYTNWTSFASLPRSLH